jgi:hypothetical protein
MSSPELKGARRCEWSLGLEAAAWTRMRRCVGGREESEGVGREEMVAVRRGVVGWRVAERKV